MVKYSKKYGHRKVLNSDIKIVECGNRNNKKKRKVAEALIFKNTQPRLKKKEQLVPLTLSNWYKWYFVEHQDLIIVSNKYVLVK